MKLKNGEIKCGDVVPVLKTMEDKSVQMCVTSPPYWRLRDYGIDNQIGMEETPEEYVAKLVEVFEEVKRILKDDGILWLNIGDSYIRSAAGNKKFSAKQKSNTGAVGGNISTICKSLKTKNLVGIPWRSALALQQNDWILRQDIIWNKPNAMPESIKDRCTKSHEYIFLLTKNQKYYYNHNAIREPQSQATIIDLKRRKKLNNKGTHGGTRKDLARSRDEYVPKDGLRNKRSIWTVPTKSFKGAHFAVFPPELITPCILAGSKENDVVLDPFFGSGTTGVVCEELGRKWIGIDLNPEYIKIASDRINLVKTKTGILEINSFFDI